MFENAILGIIQGIAEWLPVSSEGLLVLAQTSLFSSDKEFTSLIEVALFLHLGTFFAAFIYFRHDCLKLFKAMFQWKVQTKETKDVFLFLLISTLISGSLGLVLLKLFENIAEGAASPTKWITLLVGVLLLGTAGLEIRAKSGGLRAFSNIKLIDSILLGIVQGFAALPGFSRSGLTVSALLLRKFDKACALKLSFLMSLPIVLAGNILLHVNELSISFEKILGLFCAFIFGLITIHGLLKLAEKINFGYFLLLFGILVIISVFI